MTSPYDPGNGCDVWVSPKIWRVPGTPGPPSENHRWKLRRRRLSEDLVGGLGESEPRGRQFRGAHNRPSQGGPPRAARWAVPTLRPSESQDPKARTDASETPRNPPARALTFREEASAL